MTRIIDSDDYAASGIETLTFPGGEPHVKLPDFSGDILLLLKLRSWNDLGFGALVADALSRSGAASIRTFVPYFPAARQDRAPDGHAPFTLRYTALLLCPDAGRGVSVFDPHSPVLATTARIERAFMPADLTVPVADDVVGIVAPDKGATERARKFRDAFYPERALIQCSKRRDPVTGALSGYNLPALPGRGRYIIVDDICDGGGTFNLLAQSFKADPLAPDCSLELFVSHGIFSKGLDAIDPVIERITTTDSWCRLAANDRLTVLPLSPLFPLIPGVRHA
jgi:ribose-phosphate pyrophosphokinase